MTNANPLATCVAIDPGKSTGVVEFTLFSGDTRRKSNIVRRPGNTSYFVQTHKVKTYGYDEFIENELRLTIQNVRVRSLRDRVPSLVVCEDFIITNTAQRGASTWSLKLIGAAEFAAHTYHIDVFDSSQKSTDAKTAFNDYVLTDYGFTRHALQRKITPHEKDAARHMLLAVERLRQGKIILPLTLPKK